MRRIGFAAEGQRRTVFRGRKFYVRPALGVDQAEQDRFRIGCTVRQDGCRVCSDAGSNSSFIVGDLDRSASEYWSGAIHLNRPRKKAPSQEPHLDLREQKHQKSKIENSESSKKPLKGHDVPPEPVFERLVR